MASYEPRDPAYDLRVRTSFAAQAVMALIGAPLEALAPGLCTLALPFRADLTQQDGFVHAGIVTTIADSAAGYAAFTLMPADARVLTIELKINLLAPARGDRLLATGRVERAGRTITVTSAEVLAQTATRTERVALFQASMICLRPGAG